MLSQDEVAELQAVVEPPAVSVLFSTGSDPETRFEELVKEVGERLALELGADEVAERLAVLRELAATVAEPRGQQAVALFASAGHRAASRLPEPVRDRVVVDDTFATRDLVRALHRSPETLVLVLGDRARLFTGRGRVLREVADDWFPLVDEPVAVGERGRRHDPGQERDRRRQRLAREIDLGLDRHLREGDRPLFVVGVREAATGFVGATRHRRHVAGEVDHGLGAHVTVHQVSQAVWPAIEAWLAQQATAALDELDAALGARRLAAGIHEVWPLAGEGRGDLLVVEEGYELAARLGPAGTLEPVEDATEVGVLDDAVDEVIEAVLLRGGRIAFVDDGTLQHRDRIALKLRF